MFSDHHDRVEDVGDRGLGDNNHAGRVGDEVVAGVDRGACEADQLLKGDLHGAATLSGAWSSRCPWPSGGVDVANQSGQLVVDERREFVGKGPEL